MLRTSLLIIVMMLFPFQPVSAGDHGPPDASPKIALTPTHGSQSESRINPNDILAELLKGNKRFTRNSCLYSNQDEKHRTETAQNGQKPLVTILSCSDSRVPLEIIFDQGIGDIFAIRIAGNVADKIEIGSVEYGTGHLGTPLLMVLGHTKCGAVTAAVKNAEVKGSVSSIIARIKPAVDKIRAEHRFHNEDDLILKSIKAHIFQSIEDIFAASEEVRTLVRQGKLKVIGALYDIETGEVTNLGVHYRQEALVRGKGK